MTRQKTHRITRLRQLRRAREWSQQELAQRIGVHQSFICAIEKGQSSPSLGIALQLARVFETPVEKLFDMVEIPA